VSALAGLRVVDLTRYIPGPYCTMLLADLGADVVKIEEPPIGDPTRIVPPPLSEDSALHAALNRNKRSVLLDLRQDEGVAIVRKLAARADVFVEAFRPGTMARRGLGYDDLRTENPRLVYCSLSGYGQDGPLAQRAGHDVDYAALSGFLGTNCDADGHPVLPATQVADMAGGLSAALGILAALQARERTGCGQLVDVSMFQAALALMTVPATRALAGGSSLNELSGHYACYNVYRCRDGKAVAVGALEPKFWENLCRVLDLPHLANRQWARGDVRREAADMVARAFSLHDREEWLRRFEGVEACVEPVLSLEDALAQPQADAYRFTQPSGAGTMRTIAPPLRLSDTPVVAPRAAPGAGEHNAEVLAELGLLATDIERLRATAVIA
jgi:crotonobetainyl-CoA:carnitine CoA-transferase CaiB-like acyl-CoA transferase